MAIGYHTNSIVLLVTGVNHYVFDEDTSISSLSNYSVCHFLPRFEPPGAGRGAQNDRNPNLWLLYLAGCRFLCF
jgi:hypothetical protein